MQLYYLFQAGGTWIGCHSAFGTACYTVYNLKSNYDRYLWTLTWDSMPKTVHLVQSESEIETRFSSVVEAATVVRVLP